MYADTSTDEMSSELREARLAAGSGAPEAEAAPMPADEDGAEDQQAAEDQQVAEDERVEEAPDEQQQEEAAPMEMDEEGAEDDLGEGADDEAAGAFEEEVQAREALEEVPPASKQVDTHTQPPAAPAVPLPAPSPSPLRRAPQQRAGAPAAAAPAGHQGPMTRGRRSSLAQHPQLPAITESGASPAIAPLTPGSAVRHAVVAEAAAAAGDGAGASPAGGEGGEAEGEGLTTRLMQIMDDNDEDDGGAGDGWGGMQMARRSIGGGRGSVGSNMVVNTTTNLVSFWSIVCPACREMWHGLHAAATARLSYKPNAWFVNRLYGLECGSGLQHGC